MSSNCNEIISDIVGFYIVPSASLKTSIPATVKLTSLTPALMGISSWPAFLSSQCRFLVSSVSGNGDNAHVMEEKPQVKLTSKRSSIGNIFTLTATVEVNTPSSEEDVSLISVSQMSGFDIVAQYGDGTFRWFRSLPATSFVQLDDNTRGDRVLSLKFTAQSVNPFIPVLL